MISGATGKAQAITMHLVAVLLLAAVAHAAPVQFSNPGTPPDVVGLYIGKYWIGASSADGSFTYQGADNKTDAASGVYLSYQCVGDGSGWNAVYLGFAYGANGSFTTSTYCEKGSVSNGLYVSTFAETEACPLTSSSSSISTQYYTQVPGSSLGALLNAPYCTASQNGVLAHPISSVPPVLGV